MKKLPRWAIFDKVRQKYIIDPEAVYPIYLKRLGYSKITQHGLETARLCFTRDLSLFLAKPIHLKITKNDKWKLSNFPIGNPLDALTEHKRITNLDK